MTMIYLVAYSRTSHYQVKKKKTKKTKPTTTAQTEFRAHSVHALD